MTCRRSASFLLLLFLAYLAPAVVSLSQPLPVTARRGSKRPSPPTVAAAAGTIMPSPSSSTALRGGAASDADSELKNYSDKVSGLFGNLRVPAALFAGASAGAAFAMPIANAEGLKIGLVKRLYALLMISSLASQIIVVVVATLAMGALSMQEGTIRTKNVGDLIKMEYDLEWTTARFSFLSGLCCFSIASGMRAWVSIACPVFGNAALGVILSATLLCLAFVRDITRYGHDASLWKLPFKLIRLVSEKARKDGLFGLAMLAYLLTFSYMAMNVPHVMNWLAAGN